MDNNEIQKLEMKSKDVIKNNIYKLQEIFPNCIKEGKIDINQLMYELGINSYEKDKEKFQITWAGKKEAIVNANKRTTSTLRPVIEHSVNFDETKNIYIEGDNLETLKILQESYLNKVKCIYVDPPYNTGKNLIYKNDYSQDLKDDLVSAGLMNEDGIKLATNLESNGRFHSDWLSMIYPRVKLARNLLREDGVIVFAIDDSELVNLVKVCDEIFGESNRLGIVTVVHKPEGRNQAKYFATSNEYALFYAKNADKFLFENVILDESMLEEYKYEDEKGKYKLISAIAKNHGREGFDKNLRVNNPKNYYPIYVSKDLSKISLEKIEDNNYIVYPVTTTQERTWRYIKESMKPKIDSNEFVAKIENGEVKIYEKYRVEKGQLVKTHWIDKKYNANTSGTKILDELMKVKTFDFPKSLYLMEDIIKLCSKENDIILDLFSGSATTAHAIIDLNNIEKSKRQFILVQIPESINEDEPAYKNGYKNLCEIGEERIRRAAKKIKEETNADIDYGFRVYKVDSSNMKDVYYEPSKLNQTQLNMFESNIKEERTAEDLLIQVLLDLGVTLDLSIEEKDILNNKVYFVGGNSLVACFDEKININIINEICKEKPLKIVFKENSFKNDSEKINIIERINKYKKDNNINEEIMYVI